MIVAARGITVVMKNTYITDTVLHWMEDGVSGHLDAGVRRSLAFLVNIPIAFLVPSSSGHAALVMPILAPLADFAGVARSITVTGFQSASGFVNYLTPTSAVVMGGLTLAKVRYDRYLRFLLPFLAIVFVRDRCDVRSASADVRELCDEGRRRPRGQRAAAAGRADDRREPAGERGRRLRAPRTGGRASTSW